MSKKILGKKLLFITAHPDDETFLASGTIFKNAQMGGSSFLICATAGERGRGHMKKKITISELKKLRRKELVRISRLARLDALKILNFPDTKLSEHKNKLKEQVVEFLNRHPSDIIVSFGPDGVTGHLDHIACSRVAEEIARKTGLPLVCFCGAPALTGRAKLWLENRRKHGKYHHAINHAKANIKIKTDPKLKLKCLLCHKSQQLIKDLPERALQQILNYEYFYWRKTKAS